MIKTIDAFKALKEKQGEDTNNKRPVPYFDLKKFEGEAEQTDPKDPPDKGLDAWEHLRVTLEKEYPFAEPVIKWHESPIAAPGNITGISAQAKAGKTAFLTMLVGCSISANGFVDGFAGVDVVENKEGKAVIVFDTEQAEADQQYNVRTACKRAGFTSTPKNLFAYNIRQLHLNEYQQITDTICEAANAECGGIHSLYIDGAADYIADVNHPEDAKAIVQYFIRLSILYGCPIILVIHQNPNGSKERGHLGSEIQRKCYGMVNIANKDGLSEAKLTYARKAGEVPPIYFKYDTEKGYHNNVDAPKADDVSQKKLNKIQAAIKEALPPLAALKHNELIRRIMAAAQATSDRTAKDYLKVAIANNWVVHADDLYRPVISGGVVKGN